MREFIDEVVRLLRGEPPKPPAELIEEVMRELQPVGPVEEALAERAAFWVWMVRSCNMHDEDDAGCEDMGACCRKRRPERELRNTLRELHRLQALRAKRGVRP